MNDLIDLVQQLHARSQAMGLFISVYAGSQFDPPAMQVSSPERPAVARDLLASLGATPGRSYPASEKYDAWTSYECVVGGVRLWTSIPTVAP